MMRRQRVLLVLLAVFALAGLGACGSGGGGGGSCPAQVATRAAVNGAVSICAADSFRFDAATITATPGKLTVTMKNAGSLYHTFKIENTALELKANGGKSATGSVTLAKGTYTFECTVPGHAAAGMKGKLVVG